MNCKEIIDNLEAYIQNELGEKENSEMEKHLTECPDCLNEYVQIKTSIDNIKKAYSNIEIPEKLNNISVFSINTKGKKHFSRIKKAAIAIACVFALLLGIFIIPNSLFTEKVSAGDYRGGFSLTPLSYDSTGVKTDSEFILESQNSITLSDLEANLSIDNEPAPIISENGKSSFKIKPSRAFEQNRLYTFRIKSPDRADITWTFQTNAAFKILGTFPADKTANVPTNSGIEIYFSHEEFEDVDKYFEISPKAEGRFERHKKAVVFVPKDLKESTIYTIKIKKGLKLKDTNYALTEDLEFQFETTSSSFENELGFFSYSKDINEYTTKETPYLPINFYTNDPAANNSIVVDTSVYAYKDVDTFIKVLENKNTMLAYSWAYRYSSKNLLSVDGLEKIFEFKQELSADQEKQEKGEQYIKLPDTLPQGYYVVDSKWNEYNFQTIIQVTDIGMYITNSIDKTLIWLHDLSNKAPLYNAKISVIGSNTTYTTNNEGIAYFDAPKNQNNNESSITFYKIETDDNKHAVLSSYYDVHNIYEEENTSMYWNFIQLDRNLYKPNDKVNFWGMVKSRYSDEKTDSLVIEIDDGYGYIQRYINYRSEGRGFIGYYPMSQPPLVTQNISASDGIFSGSLDLPNLDPGGYQLTVKKGDKVVVNSYIQIENYTKPAYELKITKDKEAIFPGEEVNFNIKGSFFEGTGVPDLDINYSINDYSIGAQNTQKTVTTDSLGSTNVKYIPNPTGDVQGEQYVSIYAHATKPEIGEISGNTEVRVFVNDIDVDLKSELTNQKGVITANANEITLDRINNGTAKDSYDYLGEPVNGKTLTGTIYKHTWLKIEDGEYYDYINKVTQKKYRYEEKKEPFGQITMTTDSSGKATASFDAPEHKDGFYRAELKCTDNSGRNMKFDCYFGDYSQFDYYENNRYLLDGGKEKYKLNEQVDLTFKKGKNTLPEGKYLFIKSQNGIKNFEIRNNPNYSFTMDDKDIPNAHIRGVYFNGLTYIDSEEFNCVFDAEEKELTIDAKLDKTSYKPGDEVTVKINAKDKDGKPTKAVVNTSIVDEALFKLNEQYIETLHTLYAGVPSGVIYCYASHAKPDSEEVTHVGIVNLKNLVISFNENIATRSAIEADDAVLISDVRSDFRDTAYFNTITLNDEGYGELTFKIPDNITAWRLTLSGVTTDLLAGSNTVNLDVTLPFFINYTLNSTYLVGDKPVLGVTAYGNDLKEDERVLFEVYDAQNQKLIISAKGKAFERVNLPLAELSEGKRDIIIKASTSNGLSDSLKHSFEVVKTYHQIEEALYYDLSPGIKFEGGTKGNTKLIFTDKGKGMYLNELNNLMYTGGNRIDQKLTVQKATELIKQYFELNDLEENITPVKASDYQTEDGGIAILPYGNSDIDISAKLSSLLKDQINVFRLKDYFYTKLYDDSPGLKGNALYGLAVLREPILLDIDKASEVKNAQLKDLIYIALAYCELGELPKADRIFVEKIGPHIKSFKPYYKLDAGKDKDDILEYTALAAVLASKLDKPHKSGLYKYCTDHTSKEITTYIERLMYIEEEIKKASNDPVSFSYTLNGKEYTKSLDNGISFTLTLPSENLGNLNITKVNGDISMVSMFKKPLTTAVKVDKNLTVNKSYYNTKGNETSTNFIQSDIVKVVITWNAASKALDGMYQITDYLPSGLKPIDNPISMGIDPRSNDFNYMEADEQKVTFFVNKDYKDKTLTYYARVISPGTYTAESTIIQSVSSKESMSMSTTSTIEIINLLK